MAEQKTEEVFLIGLPETDLMSLSVRHYWFACVKHASSFVARDNGWYGLSLNQMTTRDFLVHPLAKTIINEIYHDQTITEHTTWVLTKMFGNNDLFVYPRKENWHRIAPSLRLCGFA